MVVEEVVETVEDVSGEAVLEEVTVKVGEGVGEGSGVITSTSSRGGSTTSVPTLMVSMEVVSRLEEPSVAKDVSSLSTELDGTVEED